MKQSEKVTALYARLSQEDKRAGYSTSIENQLLQLKEYADANDFRNTKTFVDDGLSGVFFDRRNGLQDMLAEIEAGHISTVITKDLSRLGRNNYRMSELFDAVFAELGVRCIAVDDGVDTTREDDDDIIGLRNWLNERYVREASKKVRSVKRSQAKRGQRTNGSVPYGYIRHPDNRDLLIPDTETSHVVRHIFSMRAKGARIADIQNWLKENEVATPTELDYRRKGKSRNKRPEPDEVYSWHHKTLYDILEREEYIGHTYTGKVARQSYKSRKTIKIPKEEQNFFPNTHEPLIDKETFAMVRKRAKTRNRPNNINEIDIFSGVLFCADCGNRMYAQRSRYVQEKNHSYSCGTYRNGRKGQNKCTMHFIRKVVLKELVLAELKRVLVYVKENEINFIHMMKEYGMAEVKKTLVQNQRELDKVLARITEIDTVFRKTYEDKALYRITEQQFAMLTSGYEREKQNLTDRVATLEKQAEKTLNHKPEENKFMQIIEKYSDLQELTYENIHEFIDRIMIHEFDPKTNTRKIEVEYGFVL